MLDIPNELKQIYKNDLIPLVDSNIPKELTLYFPQLNLTIETDKIIDDSFELNESLCSDNDLTLGSCEAAQLKVTVADINEDLNDQTMIVTQLVNGIYDMPLGIYTVKSVTKQSDLRFKDIVAYDAMKGTDKDVSAWYNGLVFPITKKVMLQSLLTFLNIAYENQTLPNDDVSLEKTINPSYLKGRDVLSVLCVLSGGFGHITRLNKFKTILLSGLGLYPSETLYPAEDLFPSESNEFIAAGYMSSDYEEYIVEPITGVKITQDDEDYGTSVGTSDNIYTITGNFLLYGKSSAELKTIAENILLVLKNKYYRPHSTTMIGLPYIEVGDAINIITTDDAIETFVFQRTLKGIQALTDEMSATGNKVRSNIPSRNNEIQQLKGKTLKIVKSIEELSSTMTNIEDGLESKITQTAGQLQAQITDNKNDLQSQITQSTGQILQTVTDTKNDLQGQINVQAGIIDLKVSQDDLIASINLSPGSAKIQADKIVLEGLITANNYFKILLDGSIEARNAKMYGYMQSSSGNNSAWLDNGVLSVQNGSESSQVTATYISTRRINDLQYINGYTPITSQNIGQQTVSHANTATTAVTATKATNAEHSSSATNASNASLAIYANNAGNASNADSLGGYVYASVNGNLRPYNNGASSCGTSDGKWTSVWANNGTIQTSDERLKTNINLLETDIRFLEFAKMIVPYTYKMLDGTSGRNHIGFIAQRIEEAMEECNISSMEFAGLVKAPVYLKKLENGEYDTTSEVIDYTYHLRYDEFIPLIFLLLHKIVV